MRDPKGKTVSDLFPQIFENEDDDEPPISDEDAAKLQALMARMNQQNKQEMRKGDMSREGRR